MNDQDKAYEAGFVAGLRAASDALVSAGHRRTCGTCNGTGCANPTAGGGPVCASCRGWGDPAVAVLEEFRLRRNGVTPDGAEHRVADLQRTFGCNPNDGSYLLAGSVAMTGASMESVLSWCIAHLTWALQSTPQAFDNPKATVWLNKLVAALDAKAAGFRSVGEA